MPEITEVHMGTGRMVVPFFRDPGLEDLIDELDELIFREGRHDRFRGPITQWTPGDRFVVEGPGPGYWLGIDQEGAGIELRRYFSRLNKLSNGDFELGDLTWRRQADNSKWVIDATGKITGSYGARTTNDFQDDDVLQNDERFEVFYGDKMRLRATFDWDTSTNDGSARLRLIYEGRFTHPELNEDTGFGQPSLWELGDSPDIDIIIDADQAYEGTHVLRVGPFTKEQQLNNGDFEDAFEFWDAFNNVTASSEHVDSGSLAAKFSAGGADTPVLHQQMVGDFSEGDEFEVGVSLYSADADTTFIVRVSYPTVGGGNEVAYPISEQAFSEGGWRRFTGTFTLHDWDPDLGRPTVVVGSDDIIAVGGAWYCDRVNVKRIRGNVQAAGWTGRSAGSWVKVVPKRRYRVRAKVRAGDGVYNGEIWMVALTARDRFGRDLEEIESPHVMAESHQWQKFDWTFTPESGRDHVSLQIWGRDVYGGGFYVDVVKMNDDDETSLVENQEIEVTEAPSPYVATIWSDVPRGAEECRVEIVAEAGGEKWQVDNVELRIDNQTPTHASEIVSELIADAGVLEGTVRNVGKILFDWVIRNRTARQVLDELCMSGLVQPACEWSFTPGTNELNFGRAEQIFTDRDTLVITDRQAFVLRRPSAKHSIERFATDVKVIGAPRTRLNGREYVVTGRAENDNHGWIRPDGSPFQRTSFVEDGSVQHRSHANGLAANHAADIASAEPSHVLALSDWRTAQRYDVGDWGYFYFPDEKIVDESNVMVDDDGQLAYPARLRVYERRWILGSGPWRCILRQQNGNEIDITEFVDWPDLTEAEITIGKKRRRFTTNPQGGAIAKQYQRFRAAKAEV